MLVFFLTIHALFFKKATTLNMKVITYCFIVYVYEGWGLIHLCPLSYVEEGENMRKLDKSEMF